jgi:hypothetical protein
MARSRARSAALPPCAPGAANGKNPISIIAPCHRVIGATGELTGFAGGLHAKETLLALEGISCPATAKPRRRATPGAAPFTSIRRRAACFSGQALTLVGYSRLPFTPCHPMPYLSILFFAILYLLATFFFHIPAWSPSCMAC